MGAFKAYDIRGIYNKDFNRNDVYAIGFFLPELLHTDKVLVGRDARTSSDEIFEALTRGIIDAGADVYDLGLATTPLVYYATACFGFDASVQITASHNPKEYNGLKISKTDCLPVGYDTGLGQLESWLINNKEIKTSDRKGKTIPFDAKTSYVAFLKKYLPNISSLNMAIDCSNGMVSLFAREIFGNTPHYLFENIDCSFPNHEPNPLETENTEPLRYFVKQNQCDIGLIFDGDADRVMFVDEAGNFISPDLMIAIAGMYFSKKMAVGSKCFADCGCDSMQPHKALIDIRTSKSVKNYLKKTGYQVEMWRVGRAYAAIKLREINGLFGGELAGHYYFRDFYYSDSGLLAALILLDVIAGEKAKGNSVSKILQNVSHGYFNSGEINFRIGQKEQAMEALRSHFCTLENPVAFYDFDGYRIEFNDWWFNVRPSNTEPYLRFIAEATDASLLKTKIEEVKKIIQQFS
ncbi:MAG: phosphomannomutase/phosphoglucomutase [Lentimicrobiaceae bacterium]|nr:phosphomannomutase/phosphoglucomutase [Lentimicrobiaceae bacterium]